MAKLCFSSKLHSIDNCLLQTTLILLLSLRMCTSQDTNTIVLNSCEHCADSVVNEYEVSADRDYSVTVSSSADSACTGECKARVYSSRNSSWLCVAQLGIDSHINDSNGELTGFDSHKIDIFILKYRSSTWRYREDCRKTDFVDFYLRKVKPKAKLDFEKLHINFQVLDIESTNRKVYLDGTYCLTEYKLLNSQISIYNQPEETEHVTYERTLTSHCGVQVQMVDTLDTNQNRICLYYLPTDDVNCNSNWTFSVSVAVYSTSPADMIYTLNCGQNRSRETHAWCADLGIRKVMVIFQRTRNVLKSVEHPRMFRFLVLDYNGTAEDLMAEKTNVVKELHKPPQDEVIDNNKIVVICILVSIAVAVLVIVVVFLYNRRRCLSRLWYGQVHNPGNATAC